MDIPLGFADAHLHPRDSGLHYDMWPAFGPQMTLPVRGPVANKKLIRNTASELVLQRGKMTTPVVRLSKSRFDPALKPQKFAVLSVSSCCPAISERSYSLLKYECEPYPELETAVQLLHPVWKQGRRGDDEFLLAMPVLRKASCKPLPARRFQPRVRRDRSLRRQQGNRDLER